MSMDVYELISKGLSVYFNTFNRLEIFERWGYNVNDQNAYNP